MKIKKIHKHKDVEDIFYISNDGVEFTDEESCIEHETNFSKYKEISNNLEVPIKIKNFYNSIDEDMLVECISVEEGPNFENVKWYKVSNSEETKAILKAHLTYYDFEMEWADSLEYPDYIAVSQGEMGGMGYSYKNIVKNSRKFIELYNNYLEDFEKQFVKAQENTP